MNYQDFATYNNKPPEYGTPFKNLGNYDQGQGVPKLTANNITVQDIYRTPFLLLQEHRTNYPNMSSTALKGIQTDSELSRLFFSDTNIVRLQKMIKRAVFERTKGEFKLEIDQDVKELLISMRSIYLLEARFLNDGMIIRQAKRLNQKVIDEAIPGIITNIRQYYGYLREINKSPTPITRPINTSNAGRSLLPSISTTFV